MNDLHTAALTAELAAATGASARRPRDRGDRRRPLPRPGAREPAPALHAAVRERPARARRGARRDGAGGGRRAARARYPAPLAGPVARALRRGVSPRTTVA